MDSLYQFRCPSCSKSLKVKPAALGKVIKCPGCQAPIRVKAPENQPQLTGGTAVESRTPSPIKDRDSVTHGQAKSGREKVTTQSALRTQNSGAENQVARSSIDQGQGIMPVGVPVDIDLSGLDLGSLDTGLFDDLPAVPIQQPMAKTAGVYTSLRNSAQISAAQIEALKNDISKQLSTKIRKHGTGIGYRLGLVVTAGFMLILPLIYCALIGASAYGLYWYVCAITPDNFGSVSYVPRGGRAAILLLLILLTPIFAGVLVILFMIKPIFMAVLSSDGTRQRSLRREGEPLLFHLVDKICEVTGAPLPSRIDVDCNVNAAASYGRGLRSLFRSDLVLTIGVPLISGLSAQQLAGVLAHEFGHFSQGGGMRASYIIRSMNHWFSRVVYHRDGFDEMLDTAIRETDSAFVILLLPAKGCVMLTRGIMWLFMMAAHAGSCMLMRQMEFDADRYEAELCGSKNFSETCKSFKRLGYAEAKAMQGLIMLVHDAVLIDNIPYLVEQVRNNLSSEDQKRIAEAEAKERTGIFDSHPADSARIKAVEAIAAGGILDLQIPARNLIQHYDPLCRNVTQDFYRNVIGRLIDPSELAPVSVHLQKVLAIKIT